MDALSKLDHPKAKHSIERALIGMAFYETGKKIYQWGRTRATHTVSITNHDQIYGYVHEWLLKNVPEQKHRSLRVETSNVYHGEDSSYSSGPGVVPESPRGSAIRSPELRLYYDSARSVTIEIEGSRVDVSVSREAGKSSTERDRDQWNTTTMQFTCYSLKARDAVLRLLASITKEHEATKVVSLYIAMRYGGWESLEFPQRALDTVVLKEGQKERIVDDLAKFLAEEKEYARLGIPWHRGYLLHGPAGTGKTSLAKAIATHFEMDSYYVPLSDLSMDTDLIQTLSKIRRRSILILEDIDVVHAAKDRDDNSKGITMSGLLNALDGMVTPHGLVTIMTTNNVSALDPALIRAGRADLQEKLDYVDADQFARLIEAMTDVHLSDWPERLKSSNLTHAQIIETMKRHIGNPREMADAALRAYTGKMTPVLVTGALEELAERH